MVQDMDKSAVLFYSQSRLFCCFSRNQQCCLFLKIDGLFPIKIGCFIPQPFSLAFCLHFIDTEFAAGVFGRCLFSLIFVHRPQKSTKRLKKPKTLSMEVGKTSTKPLPRATWAPLVSYSGTCQLCRTGPLGSLIP